MASITRRNRKTAELLAVLLLSFTVGCSWIVYHFLPISNERLTATVACAFAGIVLSSLVYLVVTAGPDLRKWRMLCSIACLVILVTPIWSALYPRVSYSQFGFTVFGITPVPVLDITINRYGILWFRQKTHLVTKQELESLIADDVEIVIVGIGWNKVARLADEAKLLEKDIDLRVLSTPEAFELYNRLKAEGRAVVLLAHTTC